MPYLSPIKILAIGLVLVASASARASANSHAALTIKEVVESIKVPASDMLRAAHNPRTEEEWQILEHTAIRTITANSLMDPGGTGPDDKGGIKDPAWQAFSFASDNTARDSLEVTRNTDIDRLLEAGYELYPLCKCGQLRLAPGAGNR